MPASPQPASSKSSIPHDKQIPAGPNSNRQNRGEEASQDKGEEGEQCGLSLDQLGHEDVGNQQELRTEEEQNKFVAGIIRRGLYKENWKLVITGAALV